MPHPWILVGMVAVCAVIVLLTALGILKGRY